MVQAIRIHPFHACILLGECGAFFQVAFKGDDNLSKFKFPIGVKRIQLVGDVCNCFRSKRTRCFRVTQFIIAKAGYQQMIISKTNKSFIPI
jgi:hypothetical protein